MHSPSASSSIYSLLPSLFLVALSFSLFYLYFPSAFLLFTVFFPLFFYFRSSSSRFLITYILLFYCLICAKTPSFLSSTYLHFSSIFSCVHFMYSIISPMYLSHSSLLFQFTSPSLFFLRKPSSHLFSYTLLTLTSSIHYFFSTFSSVLFLLPILLPVSCLSLSHSNLFSLLFPSFFLFLFSYYRHMWIPFLISFIASQEPPSLTLSSLF